MAKTDQVQLRFNVEVHDADSLRTFAETIQRVDTSRDFTVEEQEAKNTLSGHRRFTRAWDKAAKTVIPRVRPAKADAFAVFADLSAIALGRYLHPLDRTENRDALPQRRPRPLEHPGCPQARR